MLTWYTRLVVWDSQRTLLAGSLGGVLRTLPISTSLGLECPAWFASEVELWGPGADRFGQARPDCFEYFTQLRHDGGSHKGYRAQTLLHVDAQYIWSGQFVCVPGRCASELEGSDCADMNDDDSPLIQVLSTLTREWLCVTVYDYETLQVASGDSDGLPHLEQWAANVVGLEVILAERKSVPARENN